MHFLQITLVSLLTNFGVSSATSTLKSQLIRRSGSQSSPNPIASQYPNDVTGTINGTVALVPISYSLARSIIPAQYKILKNAYKSLLPNFPADTYPLVVRPCLDHDIQLYADNISVPDFQKVTIAYPFIDLLGDGYSSFTYSRYLVVTASNLEAQAGAASYGQIPVPANFTPGSEAYAFSKNYGDAPGEIFLDAYTNLSTTQPSISTKFQPTSSIGPWPLEFYVNVTNQPIFADGIGCDNQINIFNTSLSRGKNAPVGVKGQITMSGPFAPSDATFRDVHGVKVDIAFIENNLVPCGNLKGYSGTGPGD